MPTSTALVTGGSGGIGAAIVRHLAAQGHRVAIQYHKNQTHAVALAQEVGGIALPCDLTQREQVGTMVDNMLEKFCQLDILVCAAGVSSIKLLSDLTEEEWRHLFDVNVDGVFRCCQALLPHFVQRKQGKIVTISSMWGEVGASCEVAYSASKAAVIGFTKALAKELGPSGITVNCVSPGVIQTAMNASLSPQDLAALKEETPLGAIGTPEQVAAAVGFLVSSQADFITGQVLGVNGGLVI